MFHILTYQSTCNRQPKITLSGKKLWKIQNAQHLSQRKKYPDRRNKKKIFLLRSKLTLSPQEFYNVVQVVCETKIAAEWRTQKPCTWWHTCIIYTLYTTWKKIEIQLFCIIPFFKFLFQLVTIHNLHLVFYFINFSERQVALAQELTFLLSLSCHLSCFFFICALGKSTLCSSKIQV